MSLWEIIVSILRGLLMGRENMMAENLALRQQIGMFTRTMKKPKPTQADRLFWIILYRLWPKWSEALNNFTPDTVVRWHKAGFRQFWRWKSRRRRPGRPRISHEIRALIRSMANQRRLEAGGYRL